MNNCTNTTGTRLSKCMYPDDAAPEAPDDGEGDVLGEEPVVDVRSSDGAKARVRSTRDWSMGFTLVTTLDMYADSSDS